MSTIHVGFQVLSVKLGEAARRIVVQLGNVTGDARTDNAHWYQHVGFASCPSNPDQGKSAATTVTVEDGGRDIVIASQDLRGLDLYGNLKPGDTCVYSAGLDGKAQAKTLYRGDGSITDYTTEGNVAGGRAIYSRVGKGIDSETGAPDGFSWAAPWGTMKFDQTGFHIVHQPSGAEFHLGGIAGMPVPLDQISSYCHIQAGVLSTTTSAQSMGAGPTQPLAFAPAVLALTSALQTAIVALQATVASLDGVKSGGSAAAALAASATAVTAAASALSVAALAVPAGTSSSP